jgi:hypothetical protein
MLADDAALWYVIIVSSQPASEKELNPVKRLTLH